MILEVARNAVLGACSNPLFFAHRDTLLASPTILKLKEDATFKPAFELLTIVSGDNLDAFLNFEKTHADFIKSSGLSHEGLVESMRLLSLCSLAVKNEEVSYSNVATALHVEVKDVEYWVVLAITRNLIEARMDQLAQVVLMTYVYITMP